MPKKDPMTGCMVLTLPEFLAQEDAREGKEPGGTMQEIIDDMEQSRLAEEDRYRDPTVALDAILEACKRWNEADPEDQIEAPKTVLEVLEVSCECGFKNQSTHIKIRAEKQDGSVGIFTFNSWSTSGSMWEPPDGEEQLMWEGT